MKRRLIVLCGSDSDFAQISSGLAILRMAEARGEVEVITVEVYVAPIAIRFNSENCFRDLTIRRGAITGRMLS